MTVMDRAAHSEAAPNQEHGAQAGSESHPMELRRALTVVSARHPRLAKAIGSFWGFPECAAYLAGISEQGLDLQRRERLALDAQVLEAIRTLQSIHAANTGAAP